VVEESRETVDAQMDSLKQGNIPVVFIPAGSGYRPQLPDGMKTVGVDKKHPGGGLYYYDPAQISASEIRQAAKDGTHGQLMGHLQSKEEIAQAPGSVVVQARTKDGVPIQDSEVDASKPELVAQQAAVLAQRHPEAAIEVKPTEQVIKERLAAQPEKKAAKGDVVKFTDRAGVERTGTVKHVNEMAARIEAEDGSKHEIAPSKINSVVPNTVPGNADTNVTELKKKYGIGVDTEKPPKNSTRSRMTMRSWRSATMRSVNRTTLPPTT
jgi:hypothetical protein